MTLSEIATIVETDHRITHAMSRGWWADAARVLTGVYDLPMDVARPMIEAQRALAAVSR